INIKNFVLSLLRPLFGVGSLIKSNNNIYLENLFDARMSMGIEGFRGDQILPLIGEGYMYFGFLFSPLFSIIFVRLGVFFDILYFRTDNIEVLFLSIIISFYLAQAMILNSTILINMLSFRLAIYLPVYWLGKSMEKKKGDYLFESSY